jgi:ribonuclease VapC
VIVDTSAIVAIVFQEPGFETLIEKLGRADAIGIGTPTLAETAIVLTARIGVQVGAMLERLLRELGAVEIPFGQDHWREAHDAYRRFGRGRHPAGLNFGDCLTYAVARLAGEPLLFVGSDFSRTDIEPA